MKTKHVRCCLASGLKAKDTHLRMDGFLDEGMRRGGGSPSGRGFSHTKRGNLPGRGEVGRLRKCLLLIGFYARREKWGSLHTSVRGCSPQWSQLPSQSQRHAMRGRERPSGGMAAGQTVNEAQLHTASLQRLSSLVRNHAFNFLLN